MTEREPSKREFVVVGYALNPRENVRIAVRARDANEALLIASKSVAKGKRWLNWEVEEDFLP